MVNPVDNQIARLVEDLVDEFARLNSVHQSQRERQAEIIAQVATLRASMEPTIIQEK